MLKIEVNTKAKAERIILALGRRSKSWQANYNSFEDRETYLVFYQPKEAQYDRYTESYDSRNG